MIPLVDNPFTIHALKTGDGMRVNREGMREAVCGRNVPASQAGLRDGSNVTCEACLVKHAAADTQTHAPIALKDITWDRVVSAKFPPFTRVAACGEVTEPFLIVPEEARVTCPACRAKAAGASLETLARGAQ